MWRAIDEASLISQLVNFANISADQVTDAKFVKAAVDDLTFEDCVADQLEEGLIPMMEVIH
jgi:hypothetical protein